MHEHVHDHKCEHVCAYLGQGLWDECLALSPTDQQLQELGLTPRGHCSSRERLMVQKVADPRDPQELLA